MNMQRLLKACEAANWTKDDFQHFMVLEEEHGDGLSGDEHLDDKMDATDVNQWAEMLEAYYEEA